MKEAVIYGGNIGRDFIGVLMSQSDYYVPLRGSPEHINLEAK